MHVLILRDPRESAAKCSLTPLRGLPGIEFVEYDPERTHAVGTRLLLHHEGELLQPLAPGEHPRGGTDLLLVDCSWRRVPSLLRTVHGELAPRRLPPLCSAYPRRSKSFPDPAAGLASVEALWSACLLLGRPRPELLARYRWRAEFLRANRAVLGGLPGWDEATRECSPREA